LYCEDQALQYYFKLGYKLYRRRWKTPFAEVDLLLRTPDQAWVLVEVKSVSSFEYLHIRLGAKQKRRLQRALLFCLEKVPGCRLELAVVSQQGDVLIFNDIFG
jgi:Holliday junction resolvase-like predicted endonuclease